MDELECPANEGSEELFSESETENDSLLLRRTTYDTYAKALSNARKKGKAANVKYVLQTSDSSDADGEDSANYRSPSPSLKKQKFTSALSTSVPTLGSVRPPRGVSHKKSSTPVLNVTNVGGGSAVSTKERQYLSEPKKAASKRRDCRGKENDMMTTSCTKFSSSTARKVILSQKNIQLQRSAEGGSDTSDLDLASITPCSSSTPRRPHADQDDMDVDMAQELKKNKSTNWRTPSTVQKN